MRLRHESGVALIMVVVVLMALVVIATPFTISMRNQSRDSRERLDAERARVECALLRNLVVERLKDTHPDLDYRTPLSDDAGEWSFDPAETPLPPQEGGGLERIASARVADQQGRINLNTASIYLMANLFGRRTSLSEDVAADAAELPVRSTEGFPESGLLWIEGETALYASKSDQGFEDVERAVATANLEFPVAGGRSAGSEVIDYRSFLLATYCYKWQPPNAASFPTVEAVRNIAVYGEEALERAALDRVSDMVTVRSGLPGGRRFVNPQRVLGTAGDAGGTVILVPNGRYIGAGSIARLRTGEWTHMSLVLRSVPVESALGPSPAALGPSPAALGPAPGATAAPGEDTPPASTGPSAASDGGGEDAAGGPTSWAVLLQEPLPFPVDADAEAVIEVMARHPININTAPVPVIQACLVGLGLAGQPRRVHAEEARIIAERVCGSAVKGWTELDALLRDLAAEDDRISEFHRLVVLLNGLNSSDALVTGGTAPFTFATGGYFEVETAVALDYAESGREAARSFVREILHAAPRGPVMHLFHTQAAFEEQRRLTGEGRWYTTLPENMNPPDGHNLPPSPLQPYLSGVEPSADPEGSAIRLAPVRVEGDRVLHPDTVEPQGGTAEAGAESGAVSPDSPAAAGGDFAAAAGGDFAAAAGGAPHADPDGYAAGEQAIRLPVAEPPAALLGGAYARVWPFSVELWYRFDEIGAEHYIFDCGVREESDRIYLFHDGQKLRFRVADASEPISALDPDSPLEHAEISYDFADLGLEPGVFYHITCMAQGTKPSDLCLFVDGVPRGVRAFQTRLKEPLDLAAPTLFAGGAPVMSEPMARIKVADATLFPRRGILKVGGELIEYVDRDADTFFVQPQWQDRFGGRSRRGSASQDHPATEIVELYGYSSLLDSLKVPPGKVLLAEEISRFTVARVKNADVSGKTSLNIRLSNGEARSIGKGFDIATVGELPVSAVDELELPRGVFQESGGFAVVFSDLIVADPIVVVGAGGENAEVRFERLDSERPQTTDNRLLNGFAVIEYGGYSGGKLQSIRVTAPAGEPARSPAYLNDVNLNPDGEVWSPSSGEVNMSGTPQFLRPRVFWTDVDPGLLTLVDEIEVEEPIIFVVPISVGVAGGGGAIFDDFFSGTSEGDSVKPELVQISRDFNGQGQNETEWIRYDTVVRDRFVRDFPGSVANGPGVSGGLREMYDALEPLCFRDAVPDPDTVADEVSRRIRFRAEDETPHSSHSAGEYVLPVFRTETFGVALPGRHDNITIVDDEGDRESARINYASLHDVDHPGKALIGLQEVVLGAYRREFEIDWQGLLQKIHSKEEGATEEAVITAWNLEARDYTRIVKFPSGELPSAPPEEFVLGGNLFGDPSPSRGCIDEVRFASFATPHPALPRFARYVLQEEIEEEEDNVLELSTNTLQYNAYRLSDLLLEEFEILKQLPADASLVLIGDEIIACTEVDAEEGLVSIALDGRGLFGTERGYHREWEPVTVLNFPAVSILEDAAGADASMLFIADGSGFPFSGAVLAGEEVIGYCRKDGQVLSMPSYKPFGKEKRRGLFRGRYGTAAADHYAGSLVYALPVRYADFYAPGADAPELAYFPLSVDAPGAFFSEVNWIERAGGGAPAASADPAGAPSQAGEAGASAGTGERPPAAGIAAGRPPAAEIAGRQMPAAEIAVLVRVGGRAPWDGDPRTTEGLFLFEKPGGPEQRNFVLRQGDLIECRIFTRYGPGAFDPLDFASNGWKLAPAVEAFSIECVEPSRVYRHEEWR